MTHVWFLVAVLRSGGDAVGESGQSDVVGPTSVIVRVGGGGEVMGKSRECDGCHSGRDGVDDDEEFADDLEIGLADDDPVVCVRNRIA